jgi:hypothetical protein
MRQQGRATGCVLFPSAPLRTGLETFTSSGSPVTCSSRLRHLASRVPPLAGHQVTCPPSPCGRLSRPRTTMGTPLPWGSHPEGNPEVLRFGTYQHGLGRPLIPTPEFITRYLTRRLCRRQRPNLPHGVTLRYPVWQRAFTRADRDWTSSSVTLALPRGPCGAASRLASTSPASPACYGPLRLSVSGKPVGPGI